MNQPALWYDAPEDALRALCDALEDDKGRKGLKAVGAVLFPGKNPTDAGRRLAHCLDPDRDGDKLSIEQIALLLRMGCQQGIHVAKHYLDDVTGYERSRPITPEEQQTELMREFNACIKTADGLAKRMEALKGRDG